MKYSEFIKGNEGFQYSINLQYDIWNNNKIKSYIPTQKSVEILKKFLLNVKLNNRDRANVLVGPYGKGKSHLLLILLRLMCDSTSNLEFNDLLEKIKRIDKDCGEMAEEVLKEKKFLPLVINFNSSDLNQAILVAIKNSLHEANIEGILPETYFDSAIKTIDEWGKYNDKTMIKKVEALVKEKGENFKAFVDQLSRYDNKAYATFKDVFRAVTYGIEFNPMINSDIVKLLEEINYILKEKYNYDGIVIVFDEFSKFIEANETGNNFKDLKILQDIAELCARSNTPQMHLICITHKTINEYINSIPQEKIDAWRTIEGRFKEVLFVTSSSQNYELISNATLKNEKKLSQFLKKNEKEIVEIYNEGKRLFNDLYSNDEYNKQIVRGCFPLHPYSVFALPNISEKVAQNERTLFTYLSKDDINSLVELIKHNNGELDIVTLDKLYDYFEVLFKKEMFNRNIHSIWVQVNVALKIAYSNLEKKIIKCLGIIYIVNDFKNLAPNKYTIKHCLNFNENEIEIALESLKNRGILMTRRASNTLDFLPISSVNVKGDIETLSETKFKDVNCSEMFSSMVKMTYELPKRYNNEYKMTRFFKRVFMTIDEIAAYSDAKHILEEYRCDGVIIDLIKVLDEDGVEAEKWLKKINDNRIIIVIPKEKITRTLVKNLSEHATIEYLKNDHEYLQQDKAIETQLDLLQEDIEEKIVDEIEEIYDFSAEKCSVLIDGCYYSKLRKSKFSDLISEICINNYCNTPKINNEMINKNNISSQILRARDKVTSMILDGSYNDFDYTKNAAECTIYRSTIINQGILENHENIIMSEMTKFIHESEKNQVSFKKLYEELISNDLKIGVRKGVIPIYLSFALKEYKEKAIIYLQSGRSKKEVLLDCKVLNSINENPENYLLKIEEGSIERDNFVNDLQSLFVNNIKYNTQNKHVAIVKGMQDWINSLSSFSKNYTIDISDNSNVPEEVLNFRNRIIKFDINSRQFIFEDLQKIFNCSNLIDTFKSIKEMKNKVDSYDLRAKKKVSEVSIKIINKDYKGSLSSALKIWYDSLSEENKTHLYNTTTNEFIELLYNLKNNEIDIENKLSRIMTGLTIEDWKDETFEVYKSELQNCKELIENYTDKTSDEDLLIKISINENGESKEKTFSKSEISPIGGMLLNTIDESIEEFGDSLNDNEKRSILITILERYI